MPRKDHRSRKRRPSAGKKPARTGRPTHLLDPDRREAVFSAIRAGATLRDASEAAGVGYSTLKGWRAQGRKDVKAGSDTEYSAFLAHTKKAAAEFITTNVKAITEHGKKSWQALAWLLERRRPDLFGDQRGEVRRLSKLVEELLAQLAQVRAEAVAPPVPPPAPDAAPLPPPVG
jgi:transposase